jgi:DNA (cytosine-5)-methyltransferase 1
MFDSNSVRYHGTLYSFSTTAVTLHMVGIDLFSGAGGLSIGAQWAGVRVQCAVEADSHAAATYAANHRTVAVLNRGVEEIQESPLTPTREPIVLFGGPPCKGFSTSNQRTRSVANPGNWLYLEYLRIVRLVKPTWVVFENVKGMVETEKGLFFRKTVGALTRQGYRVSSWVLNAADFGVPQRRFRLFIVGSLEGKSVSKPQASELRHVTVREAIADLPALRNGSAVSTLGYRSAEPSDYARKMRGGLPVCANHLVTDNHPDILERYQHIPPGGNWSNIPEQLMTNYRDSSRCHTGIYRRLKWNEPSVVIGNFRKNMLIHPTQNRGLSVREAARLQSFPDWFEFHGSIGFQQQQVGNAVPPLLAKAVFAAVLEASR